LIADWKRDHDDDRRAPNRPPLPGAGEAFMRMVEAGWDADVARRPRGQHTTVVVHVDVEQRAAALHLGPLLTDAELRYLTCDATCAIPGCGATRGLHAHHIKHWEDGGPTEMFNLVLVCPYHHRLHHRGVITITGPADHLIVTDSAGQRLSAGSLARPPNRPPPAVAPCHGSSGERADLWWYQPFQAQPPPTNN
jgi:Domain of unknown function (DUF222)/HNH endonuclease